MMLQGLTFQPSRLRRFLLVAVDALLPTINERASRPLRNLVELLSMLNYLAFLGSGHCPTLLHRLLRLPINPVSADASSGIDYAYMNRQLLWQAMTEAALVLVPAWRSISRPGSALHAWLAPRKRLPKLQAVEGHGCGLCGHGKPRMAKCMTTCSHVYCYYCYEMYRRESGSNGCPACK